MRGLRALLFAGVTIAAGCGGGDETAPDVGAGTDAGAGHSDGPVADSAGGGADGQGAPPPGGGDGGGDRAAIPPPIVDAPVVVVGDGGGGGGPDGVSDARLEVNWSVGDATVGSADEQLCREMCAKAASIGCQPRLQTDCFEGCLNLVRACGDVGRAFNDCAARQPAAGWKCDEVYNLPAVRPEACPAEDMAVTSCLRDR